MARLGPVHVVQVSDEHEHPVATAREGEMNQSAQKSVSSEGLQVARACGAGAMA